VAVSVRAHTSIAFALVDPAATRRPHNAGPAPAVGPLECESAEFSQRPHRNHVPTVYIYRHRPNGISSSGSIRASGRAFNEHRSNPRFSTTSLNDESLTGKLHDMVTYFPETRTRRVAEELVFSGRGSVSMDGIHVGPIFPRPRASDRAGFPPMTSRSNLSGTFRRPKTISFSS